MKPSDRDTWNEAYGEEYYGLRNLPTWTVINQEQFDKIRHEKGNALPTMAVSTIKFDEEGKPKRAKYGRVALGNLDPMTGPSPTPMPQCSLS